MTDFKVLKQKVFQMIVTLTDGEKTVEPLPTAKTQL